MFRFINETTLFSDGSQTIMWPGQQSGIQLINSYYIDFCGKDPTMNNNTKHQHISF